MTGVAITSLSLQKGMKQQSGSSKVFPMRAISTLPSRTLATAPRLSDCQEWKYTSVIWLVKALRISWQKIGGRNGGNGQVNDFFILSGKFFYNIAAHVQHIGSAVVKLQSSLCDSSASWWYGSVNESSIPAPKN